MSVKLTTPKPPPGRGPAIEQNIPRIRIELGFVPNPDGDGAILDLTKTAITYDVADVPADGNATKINRRSVYHKDWPAALTKAVKVAVKWAESDAAKAKLMGTGDSSDDL